MQITDDDIKRFQKIWREEFKQEITADEARERIARLDALYLLLVRAPVGRESAPSRSEDKQHT